MAAPSPGAGVPPANQIPSHANQIPSPSSTNQIPIRSFCDVVSGRASQQGFNVTSKISSLEGIPCVTFETTDLARAAFEFRFALVMKFAAFRRRPNIESIRSIMIRQWGLKRGVNASLLDNRHVLLRFDEEQDQIKVLSRDSSRIDGVLYKIFRWNPEFDTRHEAAKAPIWVQFKHLPPHMYSDSFLSNIAKPIGKFLRSDNATKTLSNTMRARFCVEVDLQNPLPESVWVNISRDSKKLMEVTYEEVPKFCKHCSLQGHDKDNCLKLNQGQLKTNEKEKETKAKVSGAQQVFDEMPEQGNKENVIEGNGIIDLEKQDDVPFGVGVSNCNNFEVLGDMEEGEIADTQGVQNVIPGIMQAQLEATIVIVDSEISKENVGENPGAIKNVDVETQRENVDTSQEEPMENVVVETVGDTNSDHSPDVQKDPPAVLAVDPLSVDLAADAEEMLSLEDEEVVPEILDLAADAEDRVGSPDDEVLVPNSQLQLVNEANILLARLEGKPNKKNKEDLNTRKLVAKISKSKIALLPAGPLKEKLATTHLGG